MHLLLTDRLACPRCGPGFGLILLADRIEDRRVLEGWLGCPNCRDRFPVRGGFGDLRPPPRDPFAGAPASFEAASREETVKLAALLGVAGGPGHLALLGDVARHAGALADLLDEAEVVAVDPRVRGGEERPGVSRLATGPALPFYSRSLRGVALDGAEGADRLAEALRVTGPAGRVVVLGAGREVRRLLEEGGFAVALDESRVVVGLRRPGPEASPGGGVALPVFPGPAGRNP